MLSRNILSLLISLLLTLSPMASLDVAAAVAGKGKCMMMEMSHSASNSASIGKGQSSRSMDGQMMSDCAHCNNDSCDSSSCASHGCSAGHSLSLIQSPGLLLHEQIAIEYVARQAAGLLSYSAPPPHRPPV